MQSFLNCAQKFIRVTHACAYKAAFKMSINGCNCTHRVVVVMCQVFAQTGRQVGCYLHDIAL